MTERKAEAARSTRHGMTFEDELYDFVQERALSEGDTPERTGQTVGLVSNCKVGDYVVTLGPDQAASAARIVIEAKEKASCQLAQAIDEIELARKNRGAQVGVFVMSKMVAPDGFPEFTRRGDDIFLIWDAADTATDIRLEAALSISKALCTRAEVQAEGRSVDLDTLDRAVNEVEKQMDSLEELETSTTSITRSTEKIQARIAVLRAALMRQVVILREGLKGVRAG